MNDNCMDEEVDEFFVDYFSYDEDYIDFYAIKNTYKTHMERKRLKENSGESSEYDLNIYD